MRLNFNKEQFYFLISALVSRFLNWKKPYKNFETILVIKWDEIGDMVYALGVFDQLKNEYPNSIITCVCKPFVEPLLKNNNSITHIIHEIPWQQKFDLVVELRGNWESLKYALMKSPKMRLDRGTIRIKNKLKGGQIHEVATNFEIIKPVLSINAIACVPKIYLDKKTIDEVDDYIKINQLDKFAILHTGARKKLRQWPAKNFSLIAHFLNKKFGLKLVFAGTEEDEEFIEKILSDSTINAVMATQNFTLPHFAALASKAQIFIGNESGPLHIAAVMNTALVGIYGPGVPHIFYPIGSKSKVVHHILACNPCDQIHCVQPSHPCIELVTNAEVEFQISQLLNL